MISEDVAIPFHNQIVDKVIKHLHQIEFFDTETVNRLVKHSGMMTVGIDITASNAAETDLQAALSGRSGAFL